MGMFFVGYDSPKKIIGHGRVKLFLNDGRIKTFPGVLHILGLARNLISVNKMANAGVKTVRKRQMQNGLRRNGIDEGSSVWNYVQAVGKNSH